ncbi:hypothetical protein ED562_10265 [Microcystis aeruginosa FACHB-524]|nr:hypothetical protein ED562_10265 [Microcystis aeruginosa FACHB-524]
MISRSERVATSLNYIGAIDLCVLCVWSGSFHSLTKPNRTVVFLTRFLGCQPTAIYLSLQLRRPIKKRL